MFSWSRRGLLSAFFSLSVLAIGATGVFARPITSVVAFGDSLSDNGNASALAAGFGQTFPVAPYTPGRLSNGPVWVEGFATSLGVPLVDRAFAGAYTDTRNVVPIPGAKGIGTQVSEYVAANPAVSAGNLYVVFGGANDIFQRLAGNSTTTSEQSAQNIANHISALIGVGGKQFLVPNLPNLGATPGVAQNGAIAVATANSLTAQFNATLSSLLNTISLANPTVSIKTLDNNALFNNLVATPAAFGLTNVTNNYLQSNGQSQGVAPTVSAAGVSAGSPNGFLFWDEVHPTAQGHSFIRQAALAAVVPEGNTAGLLAAGGAVLGAFVVRRRKAK